MRKITKNPKLVKRRNELIMKLYNEGFYQDEIGEMFRLTVGRVSQIIISGKDEKEK